MKTIDTALIIEPLSKMIASSLINVEDGVCNIMKNLQEDNEYAKWALSQIIENNRLAKETLSPACQDTGIAVFFVEIGQSVHLTGGFLYDAINSAVKIAYRDNRKSILDPLTRINTKDNTPPVINTVLTEGDNLKISFLAKGAGSENMSRFYMLTPSKGRPGIIESVVDCVKTAGANPCPPIIIGVGIGGDFEKCAQLSKHALLRPTGQPADNPDIAALEKDILSAVNDLNIGVQGFGGKNTALTVSIETYPTHIGMLPVAVNIQCHCVRHNTIVF